jgi:hypothetical protein
VNRARTTATSPGSRRARRHRRLDDRRRLAVGPNARHKARRHPRHASIRGRSTRPPWKNCFPFLRGVKSFCGERIPGRVGALPERAESLPTAAEAIPMPKVRLPERPGTLPERPGTLPERPETLPGRVEASPERAERLPAQAVRGAEPPAVWGGGPPQTRPRLVRVRTNFGVLPRMKATTHQSQAPAGRHPGATCAQETLERGPLAMWTGAGEWRASRAVQTCQYADNSCTPGEGQDAAEELARQRELARQ